MVEGQKSKEEIMVERIDKISDYVLSTHASTRQTAKYFTENEFPISNATVHEYLKNRLFKYFPEKYELIKDIIYNNTPKSIETVTIRKRIYSAVSLLFSDYTVCEIATQLNSTPDIIYRDLTVRLEKLEPDKNIVKEVYEKLSLHRLENLCNQQGNGPYFDSQYFSENTVIRNKGKFSEFPRKK